MIVAEFSTSSGACGTAAHTAFGKQLNKVYPFHTGASSPS